MHVRQVATTPCDSSHCPTIFATDRDTVLVQGYVLAAPVPAVDLAEGETVVEIPRALLLRGAAELGAGG